MGYEAVGALVHRALASGELSVRLPLALLPLASPEPCLVGVDPSFGYLLEKDGRTIDSVVGKLVDKLM